LQYCIGYQDTKIQAELKCRIARIYTGGRAFILSIPVTHTLYETNTNKHTFGSSRLSLTHGIVFSTIENIKKHDHLGNDFGGQQHKYTISYE
jgi:hypothetical protein